jgi:hypothetical protein
MRPLKPRLHGRVFVVWGAGGLLWAMAAILWIADSHRYGTTVALLVLGAMVLNVVSIAITRRNG